MEFSTHWLEERLDAWPKPRRYVVLASGGGDSTLLLHAMAELSERLPASVVALHFNHGLHPDADIWQKRVMRETASLGMYCCTQSLHLDAQAGALETRAREARYARLSEWMGANDCCLTAHHGLDQAETFLLQALRGAGPAGLAAMPTHVAFGPGWLARPLLDFNRRELRNWADARHLQWVEDPGNRDVRSPRNRLRHQIWPAIEQGWPSAARTLTRSAALAAQANDLAEEVAAETLQKMGQVALRGLPLIALRELSRAKRRAVLRYWLSKNDTPAPTAKKLHELEREFIFRDPGANARLTMGGLEVRRFRNRLFVVQPLPSPPGRPIALAPGHYVDLGALGRVGIVVDPHGPLGTLVGAGDCELRFRRGGESLRPVGSDHHRTLKKLLRERDILPWRRFHLPLLYVDGKLAAVGDLTVADEFVGKRWRLDWLNAPRFQ
jgi:tRNA(Ile)-lysidine synthase